MADDLIAFIKARLDEDELVASVAGRDGHDRWAATWATVVDARDPDNFAMITDSVSEVCLHIAQFDPCRVLREVAAKRKILWDHTPREIGRRIACSRCHYGNVLGANWPCLTMTSLAGVWGDHPDFSQKWVP